MKTAYLFFNYSHADRIPATDYWVNFKYPDSTKLAWFAAESWRRKGWDVKRISTAGVPGFEPFTGQLAGSLNWYALEFFNFWFKALKLVEHDPAWFFTIDVFNYGFRPEQATMLETLAKEEGKTCVTVQAQHFSASCLWITKRFCECAIELIRQYDRGEMPVIPVSLVSDETVLRHYGGAHFYHGPLARISRYAFAEQGWEDAALIHYAKSCLYWFKDQYPAV